MNAYFFKMNQAEKNDILDQHKKVYDGFVTSYGQQINQQPLYVQDYANDKEGLTVNNKGVVKTYTNMNINEADAMTGAKYLPDISFDFGGTDNEFRSEYVGYGGEDKIGDSKTDMEHGTFDDEDDEISYEIKFDEEPEFETIDLTNLDDEIDNLESLQEQLDKTLNMFKRFKKY
jgi:hypothetical protein